MLLLLQYIYVGFRTLVCFILCPPSSCLVCNGKMCCPLTLTFLFFFSLGYREPPSYRASPWGALFFVIRIIPLFFPKRLSDTVHGSIIFVIVQFEDFCLLLLPLTRTLSPSSNALVLLISFKTRQAQRSHPTEQEHHGPRKIEGSGCLGPGCCCSSLRPGRSRCGGGGRRGWWS